MSRRRFKLRDVVSWGINVKGLTRAQVDELMLQAVNMGGAVVVRPELLKAVKK